MVEIERVEKVEIVSEGEVTITIENSGIENSLKILP